MRAAKDPLIELVGQARASARALAIASTQQKNEALEAMARGLKEARGKILEANRKDVQAAKQAQNTGAFVDRLELNDKRIDAMAQALLEVANLPDPVGDVVETWQRPNGLRVEKMRLPLGVVMMIYESRPNVTSDAAALCLKSGNATILRGGSESLASNQAIAQVLQRGLKSAGLPAESIQLVPTTDRDAVLSLIQMEGQIDLCIPRGGEGLIRFVAENARVPVVKHYKGVCHIYVHSAANLKMAQDIILNAKAQRPGVCNAAECLLVDRAVADAFLPEAGKALRQAKVELRGDPTALTLFQRAGVSAIAVTPEDYGREFLDYILAVRVVRDMDQALEHIAQYGSGLAEAIVTNDLSASQRFVREVIASAVMVNASTRFNDGGELGLGAEIGISTSRLHAYGPMGLKELTAQKYVVRGEGQIRV